MHDPLLSAVLAPRSIAVIGASTHPASRGYHVWRSVSLSNGLKSLWPVNPKYRFVDDLPCYPDAEHIPDRSIDLSILCVSRRHLGKALAKLALNPPRAVLFAPQEEGPLSDNTEITALSEAATRMGALLLGPNSIGMINPILGVNASFWPRMPKKGSIALIAQSAMIATGFMDEAEESGLGFSGIINTGLEVGVSLADTIEWFAHDLRTRVIAVEVGALRNPRAFWSALRAAATQKPVVVLRPGPGSGFAADRLAASRFGTDAGEDKAFDALLASAGALRARTSTEFYAATAAFCAGTSVASNEGGAAIIANGSGVAALAADAADAAGVPLGRLSNRTIQVLHKAHPGERIPVNPLVIGAGAPGTRFAETLAVILEDPAICGASVIVGPSPFSALDPTFSEIARASMKTFKPVFVSWLSTRGTPLVRTQLEAMKGSRLIALRSPELAMKAFGLLLERAKRLRELRNPPTSLRGTLSPEALTVIRSLCRDTLKEGRHQFAPREARILVAALGLKPISARLVRTLDEAKAVAAEIGYPVVIKVADLSAGSRSAAGLIHLSIDTSEELSAAWKRLVDNLARHDRTPEVCGVLVEKMFVHSVEREFRLAIRLDAVLGPVIEFGGAGLETSLYGDYAVGLPPLTLADAERLAHAPRASAALEEYRGLPAIDWSALVTVLLRLSDLAVAIPAIRELRLEPIVPCSSGVVVLEASAALYDAPLFPDRTYQHLAVRPPQLEVALPITDALGNFYTLRALTEDDYSHLSDFIRSLSSASFFYRFLTSTALSEERIAELCRPDCARGGAWALFEKTSEGERIAASGRWSALPHREGSTGREAEFGIAVRDDLKRRGLARQLLDFLEKEAAAEGFSRLVGFVLPGNAPMEHFLSARHYVLEDEAYEGAGTQPRRWSRSITEPFTKEAATSTMYAE